MRPMGFDPTIPASERPQTHILDRFTTANTLMIRVPKRYANEERKVFIAQLTLQQ
jgi:hypothetical protein